MTHHITATVVRPSLSDDRRNVTLEIDAPNAGAFAVSFNRDLLRRVLESLDWLETPTSAQPNRS